MQAWLSPKQLPNLITGLRILLVWPIVSMILERRFDWALGLFFLAGASDALDGFLAKHFGWISRLGSLLDPLADKLLMIGGYLASAWVGLLPGWLAGLVVGRDLLLVLGGSAYYWLLHPFEGQPTWTSKFNTLCQIVLLLAVFWHHGFKALPELWLSGLIYLVAATTIISGVQYVLLWGRYLFSEIGRRPKRS
ncbi:CDP-alcohol phosphatidyltransferase family protein [Methylothermus subterraneus]